MNSPTSPLAASPPKPLLERYAQVRARSERLCEPLATEDYVIQSMEDVSPPKWHLAHTSWFFENFILKPYHPNYREFHPKFNYLFNSYYETVGARHPRAQRGLLSRPTVEQVYDYRRHVDRAMADFPLDDQAEAAPLLELGLNHEQQHQELLLTDLKHVLATNPLQPVYRDRSAVSAQGPPLSWIDYPGGVRSIGASGDAFCFDNEGPRHEVLLQPFSLASRLVTNAEYLAFIEDGGYRQPRLWLSLGWAAVQERHWESPLYWSRIDDGQWIEFTLAGPRPVDPAAPVSHVSFFEADAFAAWSDARLPTEAEWETASLAEPSETLSSGNFADAELFAAQPARDEAPAQLFGDLWEWTADPYTPYPGYRAASGAVGEYNGKFMCGQYVLRGGSCATPLDHIRPTYRNFFAPDARWQFSGIRLAR